MSTTTDAARVSGTPPPAGSVFRCSGNIGGCDKQGDDRCTIIVSGPTPQENESLYMCPFNHWRSARWEQTPNAPAEARRSRSLQPDVGTEVK